ncbi:unnamed protein product [Nezara viridula]|uniref:Uncharacterized protein n=1 Tax=Nezara viridula TaxID=85310 RepID=A0A9P0H3C6_NEZVI|nr:unnamed protein product [Nezara viridula]
MEAPAMAGSLQLEEHMEDNTCQRWDLEHLLPACPVLPPDKSAVGGDEQRSVRKERWKSRRERLQCQRLSQPALNHHYGNINTTPPLLILIQQYKNCSVGNIMY